MVTAGAACALPVTVGREGRGTRGVRGMPSLSELLWSGAGMFQLNTKQPLGYRAGQGGSLTKLQDSYGKETTLGAARQEGQVFYKGRKTSWKSDFSAVTSVPEKMRTALRRYLRVELYPPPQNIY